MYESHNATSSQTTRTVINIPADWQQRSSSLEHHPPKKMIIKIPKLFFSKHTYILKIQVFFLYF